ncbi:TPA: hypothetical protein I3592_004743, partial [Enterobacter cloacae]|nr:hypothetical protein [Enterobacter cloacae]
VGGFGIGADSSLASQLASLADGYRAGLYRMRGDGAPPSTIGAPVGSGNSIIGLVSVPVYSTAGFGLAFNRDNLWTGVFDPANPGGATWKKWWGESNTTVDTNGFIKRASPVVRLFGTGEIECNDEAEGVTASREMEGVYRVMGSCGLSLEGWTVEIPQDINGNFLCFVDITTEDDGVLTVSVFRRRFDVETAMITAGDPMDIPGGRWIDLRLQMPADSLYNKKHAQTNHRWNTRAMNKGRFRKWRNGDVSDISYRCYCRTIAGCRWVRNRGGKYSFRNTCFRRY